MQKAMFIINAFENKTPVKLGCVSCAELKEILAAIKSIKESGGATWVA